MDASPQQPEWGHALCWHGQVMSLTFLSRRFRAAGGGGVPPRSQLHPAPADTSRRGHELRNVKAVNALRQYEEGCSCRKEGTLKPPALPSRLVSTVPGLGWLHMLQVLRLAQLVLPQPLQVQSPSLNMPAPHNM